MESRLLLSFFYGSIFHLTPCRSVWIAHSSMQPEESFSTKFIYPDIIYKFWNRESIGYTQEIPVILPVKNIHSRIYTENTEKAFVRNIQSRINTGDANYTPLRNTKNMIITEHAYYTTLWKIRRSEICTVNAYHNTAKDIMSRINISDVDCTTRQDDPE